MKYHRGPLYSLGAQHSEAALALCSLDPVGSVFVSSRITDGGLGPLNAGALGYVTGGQLRALCWTSANVVPLFADEDALDAFAERLRRARSHTASLLGPADQVLGLWRRLEPHWGRARAVRAAQPLLSIVTPPSVQGVELSPYVRRARLDEVDAVLPAAAHMFTHEIGYPPYSGSSRHYRSLLRGLIAQGRTYVVVDGHRVIFKADIGSVALGVSQLQGVWLEPSLRGQGLATGMVAAAVEQSMSEHAPMCSLYVNDFNTAALATYSRVGFAQVGDYATVLL